VQQLHAADHPRFAIFARTVSGQSARFNVLHKDFESALEVAKQHAAEHASGGSNDFTFYVIEIKHRVGIEHGKLVDEPMA
jgi:hypothetical protein